MVKQLNTDIVALKTKSTLKIFKFLKRKICSLNKGYFEKWRLSIAQNRQKVETIKRLDYLHNSQILKSAFKTFKYQIKQ